MSFLEFADANIKISDNQSLKGYRLPSGTLLNRSPVKEFSYLEAIGLTENQYYHWNFETDGTHFLPIALWARFTQPLSSQDVFNILIVNNDRKEIDFPYSLSNKVNDLGNGVYFYEFKPLVLSNKASMEIFCSKNIAFLFVLGEKVKISNFLRIKKGSNQLNPQPV